MVRPSASVHDGDTVTIDLTGGLDPDLEYVFAQRPDEPEMRESADFECASGTTRR